MLALVDQEGQVAKVPPEGRGGGPGDSELGKSTAILVPAQNHPQDKGAADGIDDETGQGGSRAEAALPPGG